jgi:hypothetical protein
MSYGAAVERHGSEAIQVRRYMPEKTRYDFESLSTAWQMASGRAGTIWCDLMHDSPMWPIHGEYECRTCGRHYRVPWAGDGISPAPVNLAAVEPARSLQRGVASLGSALLPRILLFAILLAPLVHSARAAVRPRAGAAVETVCPTSESTSATWFDRSRDRKGAMSRAVQVFNRTKGCLS